MKNRIKILAAVLIAGLVSCEDAYDINQPGVITGENVFETVEDLQAGLNSTYGAISQLNVINFNALFTDNVKRGSANLGQGSQLYNFLLTPSTAAAENIWANNYRAINFANRVLIEGVNKLEYDNPQDQATEDHIAGQLYAIRAFAHLQLVNYYTQDYLDPNSLSVPYVDYIPELNAEPARNTVSEMYAFIKADLDKADSLLSNDKGSVYYINKDVVKAIRARLALISGNYQTAGTLAGELVAAYPLADPAAYLATFQDVGTTELIFGLARNLGDRAIGSLFYFNEPNLAGLPFLEMSNDLYNQLDPASARYDVLVQATSVYVGLNSPANALLIGKYPGSVSPLVNDVKVFRSSEMLLIRAEAEARAGQLGTAANSIKELRDARFGTSTTAPVYSNLEEALRDILKERRLELAYEGHRYLDLKRLGKELNKGVDRIPVDCSSFSAPCGLPRSSYKFTFPIPQEELNANTVIKQNPGY